MKKSSMVRNRGNRILIVFHQKHASGSIYTAAASINYLRYLRRMLRAFLLLSHFDTKHYSGFLWILFLYKLYALLNEKNGLAQICSLQVRRKIVKAEGKSGAKIVNAIVA